MRANHLSEAVEQREKAERDIDTNDTPSTLHAEGEWGSRERERERVRGEGGIAELSFSFSQRNDSTERGETIRRHITTLLSSGHVYTHYTNRHGNVVHCNTNTPLLSCIE